MPQRGPSKGGPLCFSSLHRCHGEEQKEQKKQKQTCQGLTPLLHEKLKEKKQSEKQREWAAHAVSLYFEMPEIRGSTPEELVSGSGNEVFSSADRPVITPEAGMRVKLGRIPSQGSYYVSEDAPRYSTYASRRSQYTDAGYQEKSASPEWDKVLESMASEIKVRHYSRKTLKTYALWSRNFQQRARWICDSKKHTKKATFQPKSGLFPTTHTNESNNRANTLPTTASCYQ